MNDARILEQLKAARAVLQKSYVKWTRDDNEGGHCAYGALDVIVRDFTSPEYLALEQVLGLAAKALHPEFVGAVRVHALLTERYGIYDEFDDSPIAFVNNQTDKATTLAVFDAAILDLEIKLDQQALAQPVLEMAEAVSR